VSSERTTPDLNSVVFPNDIVSTDEVVRVFIVSFPDCDILRCICFFPAGINVVLPPKAELSLQTRHDCRVFFDTEEASPSVSVKQDAEPEANRTTD
jgi:hypothetical protein